MSSDQNPINESGQPSEPPKRKRHPAEAAIMIVIGIILLLPGVCAIGFAGAMGREANSGLVMLWLFSIAISIAGIALIRHAVR